MDEKSHTLPRKYPTNISNFNKDNSRPSSYYDNYKENDQTESKNYSNKLPPEVELRNMANTTLNENNPTQEYLLNTTVPQNMAGINIAGKHTPTRNSLRHSRMIVMSRTGSNATRSYVPNRVKCIKLAITLGAIKTILGAAICCLSAWLLLWAPNLRKRDNPYWSGLPLLASGTFALLVLSCCKQGRSHTLKGYFTRGCKILSISLSLVAAAASLIAFVFALLHLMTLSMMECESTQFLNETCICKINPNSTLPVKNYHYVDLKCSQVDETLTMLLIISCVINGIAGFLCLWYVYLHCSTKKEYTYSKVRTKTEEKHKYIVKSNNK